MKKRSKKITEEKVYIKVPTLSDNRINNLKRIIALNRGNIKVVLCGRSTVLNNLSTKNVKLMLDCTDIIGPTIETRKITVKVSMFGRETPIEVEAGQIEKLVD